MAEGERSGLVLLNGYSPSGLGTEHAISEFTIVPARRRSGLGRAAALAAFATAKGQWELQVYRANASGFAFWPQVIAAADPVDWQVIEQADRAIHRFVL
jgi:predicted acetyltransferase